MGIKESRICEKGDVYFKLEYQQQTDLYVLINSEKITLKPVQKRGFSKTNCLYNNENDKRFYQERFDKPYKIQVLNLNLVEDLVIYIKNTKKKGCTIPKGTLLGTFKTLKNEPECMTLSNNGTCRRSDCPFMHRMK